MQINYKQQKSSTYNLLKTENNSYIVATHKLLSEKSICIYKNEDMCKTFTFSINRADRIYIELENIRTSKDIIKFCNNYGTLFNYKSSVPHKLNFRTKEILNQEHENLDKEKLSQIGYYIEDDYMVVEHFMYYVKTLQLMEQLSPSTPPIATLTDLSLLTESLISYIPTVQAMLYSEYACYEDGFESFLKAYPFYEFVFTCCDVFSINDLQNDISCKKSEYPLYELFDYYLADRLSYVAPGTKHFAKFCDCFSEIYADILNFHMKNIPFTIITPFMNNSSFAFYSFGDAILFQKILDETQNKRPLVCANELCQNLFWPNDGHLQIYCTRRCGQKVAKRKYKKKNPPKMKATSSSSK